MNKPIWPANPSATCEIAAGTPLPGTPLPAKVSPVSLRRIPYETEGLAEENIEWLPYLANGRGKHCRGKDPMTIPVEILTAAGHPPRRTYQLVAAYRAGDGGDCFMQLDGVREYADIRPRVCLPCTDGNDAEVRRCSTINCPLWPYRMGKNPHNPKRGVNPFS
jgi:hypothetical protein